MQKYYGTIVRYYNSINPAMYRTVEGQMEIDVTDDRRCIKNTYSRICQRYSRWMCSCRWHNNKTL